ncbi:MAG: hypothetical protein MK193_02800 [Lentisphaeria bacterium]|nr:hypothetical protein [Lentisphaeria bacterium]
MTTTQITLLIVGLSILLGFIAGLKIFSWVKGKIRAIKDLIDSFASSGVPPLRITLTEGAVEWPCEEDLKRVTDELEEIGFIQEGEFCIDEIPDLALRGFRNVNGFIAALYYYPQKGLILDISANLKDDTSLSVSSKESEGMDRPNFSVIEYLNAKLEEEIGLVSRMYKNLKGKCIGLELKDQSNETFSAIFTNAYKREMDWRIERGGITEHEIRTAAAKDGQEEPQEEDIELIQTQWKIHISDTVEEETREIYMKANDMPAHEWEEKQDRLTIVHDYQDAEQTIDQICYALEQKFFDNEDDYEEDSRISETRLKIKPIFEEHPIRKAFEIAQSQLPEELRFEYDKSIDKPWKADVYFSPA